jgi:hypothetical protein
VEGSLSKPAHDSGFFCVDPKAEPKKQNRVRVGDYIVQCITALYVHVP